MKILFLGNDWKSLKIFRYDLIKFLLDHRMIVDCYAPNKGSVNLEESLWKSVGCYDIKLNRASVGPIGDLIYFFNVLRVVLIGKYDFVVTFGIKPNVYGMIASLICRTKVRIALVEGLGHNFTYDPQSTLRSKFVKYISRVLLLMGLYSSTKTVVLNQDDRSDLISMLKIPTHKINNLGPIGIDLDYWTRSSPHTEISFLMCARLIREKGIFEYLEAATKIKSEFSDVKFYLLGDVDSNPSSLKQSDLYKYVESGVVIWHGFTDPKPWYNQCNVFVLPSYREGYPRSTQEAMSMEMAVITTDVPGCRATIDNGRNGVLVKPYSAEALADGMRFLIRNPKICESMCKHSRAFALENFSSELFNANFLEIMIN